MLACRQHHDVHRMLGTNQQEDGMHTSEMLLASANLRERGNLRESCGYRLYLCEKVKDNLDNKIDSLDGNIVTSCESQPSQAQSAIPSQLPST